jgi:hypothetical protein
MPVLPLRSFPALLALILLGWCAPAAADVRHCVLPDGQSVFTDRSCSEVGGVEQTQQQPAVVGNVEKKRAPGCARNIDDLLFEMNTAFQAHDANRLAGVYHWTGMSGSTAYNVMERLDAIVQRPLVEIVPVMPEEETAPPAADPVPPYPAFTDAPGQTPAETPAGPPRPRGPVALRVEQTQQNGSTPARTVFGLQKHFGCWWIKG